MKISRYNYHSQRALKPRFVDYRLSSCHYYLLDTFEIFTFKLPSGVQERCEFTRDQLIALRDNIDDLLDTPTHGTQSTDGKATCVPSSVHQSGVGGYYNR